MYAYRRARTAWFSKQNHSFPVQELTSGETTIIKNVRFSFRLSSSLAMPTCVMTTYPYIQIQVYMVSNCRFLFHLKQCPPVSKLCPMSTWLVWGHPFDRQTIQSTIRLPAASALLCWWCSYVLCNSVKLQCSLRHMSWLENDCHHQQWKHGVLFLPW